MATIIQRYGPIYGEAVNGTVQGRPNGSVYVPISNVIEISTNATKVSFVSPTDFKFNVDGAISVVAIAQDLASYVATEIYSDSACTTKIAVRNNPAGQFNIGFGARTYALLTDTDNPPSAGDTVYARASLNASGGVPVAYSNVIEVEVSIP